MRILLGCAMVSAGAVGAETAALPGLPRRVVFLGDSITYAGGYVAAVETYFLTRERQQQIEFINLGLSSETVSGLTEPNHAEGRFPRPDLHERLGRVLAQVKPDLVFACYGMNDGIYLPFDEARFARFMDGIAQLRVAVESAGARIVHLTPPVFDESTGRLPGYAAVLDAYSDALLSQRAGGWTVIDVHGPMAAALAAGRRDNPAFAFAKDGVHPDAAGQWVFAKAILEVLGARDLRGANSPAEMAAVHPNGAEILRRVTERQTLMKHAWLTATGHKRPGVPAGLGMAEARVAAERIDGEIKELLAFRRRTGLPGDSRQGN